jgi:hypothetical protein
MRVLLLSVLIASTGFTQTFGIWKLNAGRSSLAGIAPLRSLVVQIEPHAKREVFTLDAVAADGRRTSSSTILYFDGVQREFEDFECLGTQWSRRPDDRTVEIMRNCRQGQSVRLLRRTPTDQNELFLEITEQSSEGHRAYSRLVLTKQKDVTSKNAEEQMEKMMIRTSAIHLVVLSMTVASSVALAQGPPTILTIDLANHVEYYDDTAISSYATNPNLTTQSTGTGKNFFEILILADIVAINGQPAKGLYVSRNRVIIGGPSATPGQAIADTTVTAYREDLFKILQPDGTPIGSITALGISGGTPPAGGALTQTGGDWAITGGTGAFLGIHGQMGGTGAQKGGRPASMSEDPANRRSIGGGTFQFVLYLVPMASPAIAITANGPAVVHANDFTLVTAAKPAAAGELLSLFATGLGPVRGGVGPGQLFPASPVANVNSPVQVTVNGVAAQVLSATGYPGSSDGYQVNFQMPANVAHGSASVAVSAAWIAGAPVSIAVQ